MQTVGFLNYNVTDVYISYTYMYFTINGCPAGSVDNTMASHHCGPGSIPDAGVCDGYVVTGSDMVVCPGYSGPSSI